MSASLVFAVPSKGRLMEQTAEFLAAAGLKLRKVGHDRGYRGEIEGVDGVDVAFVSASEIVDELNRGRAHLGVTGEDLVRENIADAAARVTFLKQLGLRPRRRRRRRAAVLDRRHRGCRSRRGGGRVPARARAPASRRDQVRQPDAALLLPRTGLTDYRIVESLGATEGTPAAGTADIIVDITTTGATLAANGLKVLEDGVILRSEANLVASKTAAVSPDGRKSARGAVAAPRHRRAGHLARPAALRSGLRLHEGVDAHAGQQRHVCRRARSSSRAPRCPTGAAARAD